MRDDLLGLLLRLNPEAVLAHVVAPLGMQRATILRSRSFGAASNQSNAASTFATREETRK